ncbi:hypothetical protein SAMN06265375_101501 [Muriicola jejuensis]|uniref:Lipoprotein n=1 Tax=Muriicola jejuensis TaxID=504488 RepID=A0A6P0UBI2_9FLAO|nr:hypothetical protein [Muriicola jejuensis]NER09972.1 hypothetical protein [Muriicola jejuensis]SMP04233.1 hypothetical protein SAMN06265375_101501 [Muriicola jejuensis]
MKKIAFNSVFLIVALLVLSCSRDEEKADEPRVMILEDLSVLFDKEDGNPASKGGCPATLEDVQAFPVNGCGTFTLKQSINYVFGETTIETKVTVCCVCAVCFPVRFSGKETLARKTMGKVKGITVESSSSIHFRNYEISIAEGDYAVDEYGNIKKLKYKVIVK